MSLSSQLQNLLDSLGPFGPEMWLALGFCGLLLAELVLRKRTFVRGWLLGITIGLLLVAGLWVLLTPERGFLFLNLLHLDGQAQFFKGIVVVAAIAVVWFTDREEMLPLEWFALLIALVLGLFVLSMAVNLLAIYVSLELVSICSYLLTALTTTRRAAEGGIKYLLFGAISSAIMLYGMSLLYGMTGTLDLSAQAFTEGLSRNESVVVLVAGLFTGAGLLFKLASVPFHIWTPDAYDAAPVPVAAFFAVAPKAVALLVLMRLVSSLPGGWQTPLAILALAGITFGNLSALGQADGKRMLAYSTIAHAGFLLVGVVALDEVGFRAATFYAATYLFINLAAFFLMATLARANGGSLTIANFAGLGATQPLLSVALTLTMLALTGLPPTVGFTAKVLIFSALYEAWQTDGNPWVLALFGFGLLNAVISLFYYLRIPLLLFFRRPILSVLPVALPLHQRMLLALLVLPIILLFLKPDWLLNLLAGL